VALTLDLRSDPFASSPSPTLPLRAGSLRLAGEGLGWLARARSLSWEWGAGEVDAGQWGVFALAAGLEGFELVLGLELHAVEVRFVFHDLVEVLGRGKDAAPLVLGDCLGGEWREGVLWRVCQRRRPGRPGGLPPFLPYWQR
jgi:hypothetical protein